MSQARYLAIQQELEQRIISGTYPPGSQLPTEKELAEEFDVSRLTIGKSLGFLVLDGLISRTRGRGTFVKCPQDDSQPPAETASRENAFFKCLCPPTSPEECLPGPNKLLEGLSDAVKPFGFNVSITFYNDVDEELALLRDDGESRCDGFVIWPTTSPAIEQRLQILKQNRVPFIQLDSFFPSLQGNYIITDHLAGSETLIRHLRLLGHQRIAYLSLPLNQPCLKQRFAGFMAEMGRQIIGKQDLIGFLPQPDSTQQQDLGENQKAYMKRWIETVMQSPEPPTAVICSRDSIAIHLMNMLTDLGYDIPNQLSVAAFDNLNVDNWLPVPLTSIAHDVYRMGHLAGEILLHAQSEPSKLPHQFRIPPQLVIRKSTAKRNDGRSQPPKP